MKIPLLGKGRRWLFPFEFTFGVCLYLFQIPYQKAEWGPVRGICVEDWICLLKLHPLQDSDREFK